MMIASTVWTLALTTPFSPITSLPPTCSTPPTSHSIWIESVISNLPSIFASSPTTVSRVIGVDAWPFVCACGATGLGASLRPSIDASSEMNAARGRAQYLGGVRCSTPLGWGSTPAGSGDGRRRDRRTAAGGRGETHVLEEKPEEKEEAELDVGLVEQRQVLARPQLEGVAGGAGEGQERHRDEPHGGGGAVPPRQQHEEHEERGVVAGGRERPEPQRHRVHHRLERARLENQRESHQPIDRRHRRQHPRRRARGERR